MRRTLFALSLFPLALAAPACGDGEAAAPPEPAAVTAMRGALPDAAAMSLQIPQSSALSTEQATFYGFTRGITVHVNGLVRDITNVLEDVTDAPATETDGATYAVWGPWTDALSPATYRVRVDLAQDGSYAYTVEGWPKAQDASAAVTVLEGRHAPGAASGGAGSWTYDLTAAHGLDPIAQPSLGAIAIAYTLADARLLEVTFTDVTGPDQPLATSALYRYTDAADGSGTFDYTSNLDIHAEQDPTLDRRELLQVRSRWLATGPGRADVLATHGDLPADASVDLTECWDAGFAQSYVQYAFPGGAVTDGDAAACPYADRQLPSFDGFDPDAFADAALVAALPGVDDVDLVPAPLATPSAEPATYYRLARDVISGLDEQLSGVLDMIHGVTRFPATACDADGCRWGPWTDPETGVSAVVFAAETAPGTIGYSMHVQRFGDGPDAWRALVTGAATDLGDGDAQGGFDFDLATLALVDPAHAGAVGHYRAEYARQGAEAAVSVRMTQVSWPEVSAEPVDARYFLAHEEGVGGLLDLRFPYDIDENDPARAALEDFEARIRWAAAGPGVADVRVTGGDLEAGSAVLAVECWDATAASTHLDFVVQSAGTSTMPALDGPGCVVTDWQDVDFPPMSDEQDG